MSGDSVGTTEGDGVGLGCGEGAGTGVGVEDGRGAGSMVATGVTGGAGEAAGPGSSRRLYHTITAIPPARRRRGIAAQDKRCRNVGALGGEEVIVPFFLSEQELQYAMPL
jgi:hypothetical protein